MKIIEATLDPYVQEKKMDAWHNGTRGANVASMSDAKLKMNFDICVRKGYTSQALDLKSEARRRGLSWAQNASIQNSQPQPQPAPQPAPQPQVTNKVSFLFQLTQMDFHLSDAQFVRDNDSDPKKVINSAMCVNGTIKQILIDLIFAIILACPNGINAYKAFLLNNAGMSQDELKTNIETVLADESIIARLNEIRRELDESLHEDIEKHDTLNPKLWNEDGTLKEEVKDKINEIVKDFTDGLDDKEIKYKLDDIKLVGSNCSYNYNKNSDLDVHLVFDLDIYNDEEKQEMAEIIYDYARGNWNKNHDVYFYDIPVEIFVETNNTEQLN